MNIELVRNLRLKPKVVIMLSQRTIHAIRKGFWTKTVLWFYSIVAILAIGGFLSPNLVWFSEPIEDTTSGISGAPAVMLIIGGLAAAFALITATVFEHTKRSRDAIDADCALFLFFLLTAIFWVVHGLIYIT